MPKLSAIANLSVVKLPLRGSETIDAVKIVNNGYKQNEVVLFTILSQGGFVPGPPYNNARLANETTYEPPDPLNNKIGIRAYPSSWLDVYATSFREFLSDSIRGSLIDVPIQYQMGITANNYTAREISQNPIYRSVFFPGAKECGASSGSGGTFGYLGVYISSIKADFTTRSGGYFVTRDVGYVPNGNQAQYFSWANDSGTGIPAKPSDGIGYGSDGWLTGDSNMFLGVMITIDGNVECATSSGGAITKPTAIESYRKINGVWYRAV